MPSSVGSGRRGPALQTQIDSLREWLRDNSVAFGTYGSATGKLPADGQTAVLPVIADRISLPDRAASCPLYKWMPEDVAATYLNPELLRTDRNAVASRSKVHATVANWIALLRRFNQAGMLELAPEAEIPRDANDRVPRKSFFAVYKDEANDRTVCSRVPRNRLERQLGLARELLPHGSQLCDVQLRDDHDLVTDADDLENYYHKCKVSRERALTNAIGRTLPETELEGTAALAAARARLAASGRSTRQPRRWQPCVSALPHGRS